MQVLPAVFHRLNNIEQMGSMWPTILANATSPPGAPGWSGLVLASAATTLDLGFGTVRMVTTIRPVGAYQDAHNPVAVRLVGRNASLTIRLAGEWAPALGS